MYDDLIIYCTYHKKSQFEEFGLNNLPNYIVAFNAADKSIIGKNINNLNKYLNEICTIYYAWKNETNHKYIGFCHYRRFYDNIDLNLCTENSAYCYGIDKLKDKTTEEHFKYLWKLQNKNIVDILYKYLLSLNIFDQTYLHNFLYIDHNILFPYKLSYIFRKDLFVKFCEISFGFLNYLYPNYDEDNITFIKNIFNDHDHMLSYTYRYMAFILEIAFGLILSLLTNNLHLEKYNNKYTDFIHSKSILLNGDIKNYDYKDIIKWHNRNVKATEELYVNDNNVIKHIENISSINFDNKILFRPLNYHKEFLYLDIDQYIKTKDPISYKNNDYTIEQV